MNRRSFFRKLGIGAAAVAVAPELIAGIKKDPDVAVLPDAEMSAVRCTEPKGVFMVPIDSIPDGMTIDEIVNIWRQTGILLYKGPIVPERLY